MKRREFLKLNQSQLCTRAKIARMTLRNLERGMQMPERATVEKLAPALKMSVHALLGQDSIDSRIGNLTDDEVSLIEAFRATPASVQQKVWGVLQDRQPSDPAQISGAAAEWGERLLGLLPEHRQLVAIVIAEFRRFGQELHGAAPDVATALEEAIRTTDEAAKQLEQQQTHGRRRKKA